jgi:hypothetical protein
VNSCLPNSGAEQNLFYRSEKRAHLNIKGPNTLREENVA